MSAAATTSATNASGIGPTRVSMASVHPWQDRAAGYRAKDLRDPLHGDERRERCRDRSEPTESHERAIDQAHRQRDGEHNDQPYHDLRREAPATIANDAITTIKPARGPTETSIPPVRTTVACPRLMKPRAASSVRADPMLNSLRTRVFTLNV